MTTGETYYQEAVQHMTSGDRKAFERATERGLTWAHQNQALELVAHLLHTRLTGRLVYGRSPTAEEVREVAAAYRDAGDRSGEVEALAALAGQIAFTDPQAALSLLDEAEAVVESSGPLREPTPSALAQVGPNGSTTVDQPQSWPERLQARREWVMGLIR